MTCKDNYLIVFTLLHIYTHRDTNYVQYLHTHKTPTTYSLHVDITKINLSRYNFEQYEHNMVGIYLYIAK